MSLTSLISLVLICEHKELMPSTYMVMVRRYIHGYGEMVRNHGSVDPWSINSMILFHITEIIWIEYPKPAAFAHIETFFGQV